MEVTYTAVYSMGGIITDVDFSEDLEQLKATMHDKLDGDFDHETDDARIFNHESEQVYSYIEPEDQEEEQ